jgi:hypothetical protein
MKLTISALALLALFGLFLTGPATTVAADEDSYTVVVKKVEVKTTKEDGTDWDINMGKPDLSVSVKNIDEKDSKAFKTKTKDDTFSATIEETTTVKVRAGQTVEFDVLDVDAALNDSAGKIKKELDAATLKSGKLKLENFGRVISLEIEFKKS